MKMFKFAGAFAAAALVMGMASAASAVTYDLNQSAAFPNGVTYGVVTLTQNGANVDVNVTLSAGYNFVRTGNHDSFTFNTNDASYGVTSINETGWTAFKPGGNPSFGSFTDGLECTAVGCQNGGAGQQAGPLTFTITNTALANFVNNDSGYIFSADIIGGQLTGAVGNGLTPGVPEPATWAMMILGMGMVGAGMRMRRRPVHVVA
jgi:hypothetical protein